MTNAGYINLIPNTTYFARVTAINHAGTQSSPLVMASTVTWANPPLSLASTFTVVNISSLTFQWNINSNPPVTLFIAQLAEDQGFTAGLVSSQTVLGNAGFTSLAGNTTYYAQVTARNHAGTEAGPLLLGSTVTTAALPSATNYFFVSESSITIKWSLNGNNPLTEYQAKASTSSAFNGSADKLTSWGIFTSTGFEGLNANATYYAQVKARNYAVPPKETAWAVLGATVTKINPPMAWTPAFAGVTTNQLTTYWDANGNGQGTVFEAQITSTNFSNVIFT
ncbi:MAG: hypothetical protein HY747_05750, partial [Elusimicrobia bacterium]|nr:hypothetical protein [Elusimicrobiota bacterium]